MAYKVVDDPNDLPPEVREAILERLNEVDGEDKPRPGLPGCLLMVALTPLIVVYKGLILQCLWGWFVTPTFGPEPPGLLVCAGLSMFGTLFVGQSAKGDRDKNIARFAVTVFTMLTLALGLGYLIHLANTSL